MGFTGSILGGVIGWAVGGPIGGIIGTLIGGNIQRGMSAGSPQQRVEGERASAVISLVVLMAAVTKADNRVSKGEVSFVKNFLVRSFGPDNAADLMQVYRQALERDLDIDTICNQIRGALDHSGRVQLVHTLIGLAQADAEAHEAEIRIVRDVAGKLGVPRDELGRIEAMYWHDADHAYQVLGAGRNDSMDEIKTKYRDLVKKYHPDKVSHLGEEFRVLANEKFRQVQSAYETIEKSRAS